jgi:hypothetical protein
VSSSDRLGMEQKWTISGVLGRWTMTVTLAPESEQPIDDKVAKRALGRFRSLDKHFCDVVNLTEALEFAER